MIWSFRRQHKGDNRAKIRQLNILHAHDVILAPIGPQSRLASTKLSRPIGSDAAYFKSIAVCEGAIANLGSRLLR